MSSDDKEWTEAIQEFSEEKDVVDEPNLEGVEDVKDEEPQDKDSKDGAESEDEAPEEAPEGDQEAGEEAGEGEGEGAKEADSPEAQPDIKDIAREVMRETRESERSYQENVQKLAEDIKKELYPDAPETLQDKDGNPIETIEDVKEYINPATGETFTTDEAASYLLAAQKAFNKDREAEVKEVERIAEFNVDFGDKIETVKAKYAEVIKANPEKADKVLQQFMGTLKTKGDVVLEAPMDIEAFYDLAFGADLEATPSGEAPAGAPTPPPKPAPAAQAANRGDVITGSKSGDHLSKEDKEWQDVVNEYYRDNN